MMPREPTERGVIRHGRIAFDYLFGGTHRIPFIPAFSAILHQLGMKENPQKGRYDRH